MITSLRVLLVVLAVLVLNPYGALAAQLAINDEVSNTFLYTGTVDHNVSLVSGNKYTVVMTSNATSGLFNLTSMEPGGSPTVSGLPVSNIASGYTAAVDFTANISGSFIVRVNGTATGNYKLTIYDSSNPPRTFYSTFNTSKLLVNGTQTLSSNLFSTGKKDVFRFNVPQNFRGANIILKSQVSDLVHIKVLDESRNIIEGGTRVNLDTGQSVSLDVNFSKTGTYYIEVTSAVASTGTYSLERYDAWFNPDVLSASPSDHATAFSSRSLANGTHALPGLIGTNTIVFRFIAYKESVLQGTVQSNSAGNLQFKVIDAQGHLVAQEINVGNGQQRTFNKTFTQDGVYYLNVYGDNGIAGSFDLQLSGVVIDPALDSDNDGLKDMSEYIYGTNPNGVDGNTDEWDALASGLNPRITDRLTLADVNAATYASPRVIPVYNKFFAALHEARDVLGTEGTWYSFTVTGTGESNVTIALTSLAQNDELHLALYDGNKNSLGNQIVNLYSGKTAAVDVPLAPGTYYISIFGIGVGQYELGVFSAGIGEASTFANRSFFSTFNTSKPLAAGPGAEKSMPRLSLKEDWYAFDAATANGVTVRLTSRLQSGLVHVYVYDKHKTLLTNQTNIASGHTAALDLNLAADTYYIKVIGAQDAVGAYILDVYPSWRDNGDSGRSFYSTINTSKQMVTGLNTLSGNIINNQKTDVHRIDVQSWDGKNIFLWSSLQSGLLSFQLYDPTGEILKESYNIAYDNHVDFVFTPQQFGAYYLVVTATNTATGNYIIGAASHPLKNIQINFIGDGDGSVSYLSENLSCQKSEGSCSWKIMAGMDLTVSSSAVTGSEFVGWDICAGVLPCPIINVQSDKSITANFATVRKVRNSRSRNHYDQILAAYTVAQDGDVIQAVNESFTEGLNMNRLISLTLSGGYNTAFSGVTGTTSSIGDIDINPGVDKVIQFSDFNVTGTVSILSGTVVPAKLTIK